MPAAKRPHEAIDSIGSIMAAIERNTAQQNDTSHVQPSKIAKIRPTISPAVHPNPSFDGLNSAIVKSASQTKKSSRSVIGGPTGPVAPVAASPVDAINMYQYSQSVPVASSLLSAVPTLKKPKPNKLPVGGLSGVSMVNTPLGGIGIGGNIAIGPPSYIYGTANNGHIDMHESDVIGKCSMFYPNLSVFSVQRKPYNFIAILILFT